MRGRRWRVGDVLDDLRVELPEAPSVDTGERARSERELDLLLWRAPGDPEVRRVLVEVHAQLSRALPPMRRGGDERVDAVVAGDLRFAAFSGHLRIERIAPRPIVPAPPDTDRELPTAPAPAAEEKSWFSLRVLDEVGAPVDGIDVAYAVNGQRRLVTTDGSGVARLDGVEGGSAARAGLANVAAVRKKLAPRWRAPRAPNVPTGPNIVARDLHDALGALPLDAETPATLVLTPYFACNEIDGAHFAFGRSFVLSSGLELLAQIAEALSGDDGRKAMIFGHTDLSGTEALNKELSERRAKAICALFTHDAAMWEELFSGTADGPHWKEKWDVEEVQHMLNALGCTDDEGQPLKENGIRDKKTIQAIHRFQSCDYPDCPAEQAPLPASDKLGKDGRKELFFAYAKRISRKPVEADRLSKFGGAKFMGCGEYNPLSLSAKDAESRRAVIFVFDPAAEPQGLPCALRSTGPCKSNCAPAGKAQNEGGKPPYRCKVYQEVAKKCPCQGGVDLSHDLTLRFPVTLSEADTLPHTYVLESDDGTITRTKKLASDGRANEKKRVEIFFEHLPLTHAYKVTCTDDGEPYELFEFAKLPELQKRADAGGYGAIGDSASLNDHWIDEQDVDPADSGGDDEDASKETE